MITLNSVTLLREGKSLLEDASVTIHPGQHLGLVGVNGAGKSSLMALLTGELEPDKGELAVIPGRGIAHMSQEIHALDQQAIDYVLDGDAPLRAIEAQLAVAEQNQHYEQTAQLHDQYALADGYSARSRAEQLLAGLGFCHADMARSVRSYSGGWRMRLNLARTLMCPADILLLDEPTNHLDLDAIIWLEGYLRQYQGTLVIISHDRDFLDSVTDATLHIENRCLNFYRGGYSAFERLRAERLAQQQASYEKQQQHKAHMEQFVARFRAKATKARQAQSRLKALMKLTEVAPAHFNSPFSFSFPEPEKTSSPLLVLDQGQLGYNQQTRVRAHLNILPGARIGLLGANGAGKSTLIKSLAGDIPLLAGRRQPGEHLRIGYFAQHQLESLDPAASPLLHLQRLSENAREQTLRNFLGSFGFHGDKALEAIAGFSGGEKARLALAIIAWQKPNLLLLDEPTNHLDLDMRHALTLALQSFSGAMILVSHDRNLVRNTTDQLLLINEGGLSEYPGDLDDYSAWLQQRRRSSDSAQTTADSRPAEHSAQARKEQKRLEAEQRKALHALKQKVTQAEQKIEQFQDDLKAVETRLADPVLYENDNREKLKALLAQQGLLKKELAEAEGCWLTCQEALELQASAG